MYIIALAVLAITVIILIAIAFSTRSSRSQVCIIYRDTMPQVSLEHFNVDVIYADVDDDLEAINADIFISQLDDDDVYRLNAFFKRNPDKIHLNSNSHIDDIPSNVIRNTIPDAYLAKVIMKLTNNPCVEGSDVRSKALKSMLKTDTSKPSTKVTLGNKVKVGDWTITPIEPDPNQVYNIVHMLAYQKPPAYNFKLQRGPHVSYAIVHDEVFINHTDLASELDYYLY